MKVMVTGSTGFIGKSLIEKLRKEHTVIELTSKICNMENYESLPEIIKDSDIDVCVHLAWNGSTGPNKKNYEIQRSNADCTLTLIRALTKMGVKRFIGIGSLAEKEVLEYHTSNNSLPSLGSTYGVCKILTHMMSKIHCLNVKMEYTWCTLANVYGPNDSTLNFVNYTINLIDSNERARFTEGQQMYDFIFIEDLVAALKLIIENPGKCDEYYVGSGKPLKLRKYIEIIASIVKPTKPLYFGEIPYNNAYLSPSDFDISALSELGFTPKYSFEEGIKLCIYDVKK